MMTMQRPSISILCFFVFFSLVVGSSLAARNPNENPLEWVKRDHRRFLRAVIYVSDLNRSIKFHSDVFGMRVWKRRNFPDREYRDALIGFGPENTHFLLELRQPLSSSSNVFVGTEFGHFGIATQDVNKLVEKARRKGGIVTQETEIEYVNGRKKTILTFFVQDHDGYKFKLIQRPTPTFDPLCQLMLRVQDLNRSIIFYELALGMKLIRRQTNPNAKIDLGIMGYGRNEIKTTVLELKQRDYNAPRNDGRDGYSMVYIGTDNVNKSAEGAAVVMQDLGGNIILEPVLIPYINVKMTGFSDPNDWEIMMVDNKDYQRGRL